MAFSYTVSGFQSVGNKRMVTGTYTNAGGDTGGNIVTGMSVINYADANNSVAAKENVIAITGGTIAITCADGDDGQWFAVGI